MEGEGRAVSLGRVNTDRGEEKTTRRATRIAARDSFFAVFIFVKRSRRLPSPLSSPTRARRANFCGEQNRGRLVAAVMNRQLPYIRTPAVLRSIPPFFSFFSFFFSSPQRFPTTARHVCAARGDANQPTPHAGCNIFVYSSKNIRYPRATIHQPGNREPTACNRVYDRSFSSAA